jgi:uncharacterized phage protein (TIGR01671 family)
MREILFRGKRFDNGEWVYGHYVYQYNSHMIYLPDGADGEYGFDYYHIDPKTVGQYTGLTANGMKIFEGDIILFEDECPGNYEYHDATEMRAGAILYGDGMFYLTKRIAVEMSDLIYDEKIDGVVIGNIHDNPELLEGGAE